MAATAEEYADWAQYHADKFGFDPKVGTVVLMQWFDILAPYGPQSLEEATDQLLRTEYPDWPGNHLKALLPLLRDLEASRVQARAKDVRTDDRGTCVKCGGSGWVSDLPHLRCLVDGSWVRPWYTCAVFCLCWLGRSYREKWQDVEGRATPLTFDEYEGRNPRWAQQRDLHYARQCAEGKALRAAEQRDGQERGIAERLDRTLAKLAGKRGIRLE